MNVNEKAVWALSVSGATLTCQPMEHHFLLKFINNPIRTKETIS